MGFQKKKRFAVAVEEIGGNSLELMITIIPATNANAILRVKPKPILTWEKSGQNGGDTRADG